MLSGFFFCNLIKLFFPPNERGDGVPVGVFC